jgi:Leucine-rich repeat (LRR) protein
LIVAVVLLFVNRLADIRVKKIDVSFNQLKKLPDERPNLLYLVDLLLANNQLVYLPEGIGLLPEYVVVNICAMRL